MSAISDKARDFWDRISPRERRLVILLAVALPITIDIDKLDIDDQKIDMTGSVKTAEEIDLLVTELKKVTCFKDVNRGPTDTNADGTKKFKLTITSAGCM